MTNDRKNKEKEKEKKKKRKEEREKEMDVFDESAVAREKSSRGKSERPEGALRSE